MNDIGVTGSQQFEKNVLCKFESTVHEKRVWANITPFVLLHLNKHQEYSQ
jgi:hypothetical protein